MKNIWISFKTQVRNGKDRKIVYTGSTDAEHFTYDGQTKNSESGQVIFTGLTDEFKMNVGAVVQKVGFPGFSGLYTPVQPTLFKMIVGVVVQNEENSVDQWAITYTG